MKGKEKVLAKKRRGDTTYKHKLCRKYYLGINYICVKYMCYKYRVFQKGPAKLKGERGEGRGGVLVLEIDV